MFQWFFEWLNKTTAKVQANKKQWTALKIEMRQKINSDDPLCSFDKMINLGEVVMLKIKRSKTYIILYHISQKRSKR